MPQGEKTVTDAEIIRWMDESPEPAFTTAEIADNFDMTVEGIRGRLDSLQEGDAVYRKKPTSRTVIWWTDTDYDDSALSA
jgi:predicted ArsR family transcriptional regulator